MTGRGKAAAAAAGGLARHLPVLLREVVETVRPAPGRLIVDGTFGAGGYSRAFLEEGASVVGIDRDPDAVRAGADLCVAYPDRLSLFPARFSELDRCVHAAGAAAADAVVLDIGVSSMQLDEADRGFSFRFDGPLDMRMAKAGPSAADLVNTAPPGDLARVLSVFGEEKRARAVARAIAAERAVEPITTTGRLAAIVARVVGRSNDGINPATRTFQALRIAVNEELDELVAALSAAERILKPGGVLAVVTFHSLEDRIVKRFLQDRTRVRGGGSRHEPERPVPPPTFTLGAKKSVTASEEEIADNPRARSARLRIGYRTEEPARPVNPEELGVPLVHIAYETGATA